MAYEAKTRPQDQAVTDYIATLEEPRRSEAARLVAIFSEVTGYAPELWSGGMIGFGRYDYRYETGHSGTSLATGFAPRKADLSIYIMPGYQDYGAILDRLGKHRTGKSCLYLKRLEGVNETALRELIGTGLADLRKLWPVSPT